MELRESERIGGAPRRTRFDLTYLFFGLLALVIGGVAFFGWNTGTIKGELAALGLIQRDDFRALYQHLGVAPPDPRLEADNAINPDLAKLAREPCDTKTALNLADAVAKVGEERWAAEALVGQAKQCGPGTEGDLHKAASLYIGLHDDQRALEIADELTDAHPGVGTYWYVRAKAEAGLKRDDEALLSYANSIHLESQPQAVGVWVFREMSDLYASLGRYCEAIGPIEDYVARDPANRDTAAERKRMDDLSARGHCATRAAGAQSFPVVDANVIHVRVTIDGASGTLALDTGASFVAVTPAFAQKAHLASGTARLRSITANGAVYNALATAAIVKVGHVEARQVPVAILDQGLGQIDGLLGRSFLSRFEVTIGASRWSLRPKTSTASR